MVRHEFWLSYRSPSCLPVSCVPEVPTAVVVREPAPIIVVREAAPTVVVRKAAPAVAVCEATPRVVVREPSTAVAVCEAAPRVVVREPSTAVAVCEAAPQVVVSEPAAVVVEQALAPHCRRHQHEASQVVVRESACTGVVVREPTPTAVVVREPAPTTVVVREPALTTQLIVLQSSCPRVFTVEDVLDSVFRQGCIDSRYRPYTRGEYGDCCKVPVSQPIEVLLNQGIGKTRESALQLVVGNLGSVRSRL